MASSLGFGHIECMCMRIRFWAFGHLLGTRECCLDGCPPATTSARASHVEGDADPNGRRPAPKVYAGKVITDRRKTRAGRRPSGVPDPSGVR